MYLLHPYSINYKLLHVRFVYLHTGLTDVDLVDRPNKISTRHIRVFLLKINRACLYETQSLALYHYTDNMYTSYCSYYYSSISEPIESKSNHDTILRNALKYVSTCHGQTEDWYVESWLYIQCICMRTYISITNQLTSWGKVFFERLQLVGQRPPPMSRNPYYDYSLHN
jgi:hypothetical protein